MNKRVLVVAGGLTLAAALLVAAPQASAQSLTRKDIADILLTCPQAFAPPVGNVDAHRRQVIPYLAIKLNERDGADKWRLLYRLDRQDDDPAPGRLTSDVLVWTATREHYDVLSAEGAMSPIKHGAITDRQWQLRRPEEFPTLCKQEPLPGPAPVDPPPLPEDATAHQKLDAILRTLEEIKARQDRPLKP